MPWVDGRGRGLVQNTINQINEGERAGTEETHNNPPNTKRAAQRAARSFGR